MSAHIRPARESATFLVAAGGMVPLVFLVYGTVNNGAARRSLKGTELARKSSSLPGRRSVAFRWDAQGAFASGIDRGLVTSSFRIIKSLGNLSRLGKQIEEVVRELNGRGIRFALIGGLALASHKVIRATRDVDLLTDAQSAEEIDSLLHKLRYQCIHRSADAANYLRADERIDFLYASRPIARQLLATAAEFKTPFGDLRVISLEGLIGFKLQGYVNDSRRMQDLEDIRALIKANRSTLNIGEVQDYFRLFDREELLNGILNATE